MRYALAIALAHALLAAPPARADEGRVDWERKVVTCTGSGAANLKDADGNPAVARIGAEKAAKLDALRNCLATLRGVQLESGRTVGSALQGDAALSGRVQGLVRGFRTVGQAALLLRRRGGDRRRGAARGGALRRPAAEAGRRPRAGRPRGARRTHLAGGGRARAAAGPGPGAADPGRGRPGGVRAGQAGRGRPPRRRRRCLRPRPRLGSQGPGGPAGRAAAGGQGAADRGLRPGDLGRRRRRAGRPRRPPSWPRRRVVILAD